MTSFLRKHITSTRKNSCTNKYRYIWKVLNQFFHQFKILCSIILSRYMDLDKCDVNIIHFIIISLSRITDEQFTLWIVIFQPILKGSTYEAASDNSNVNHCDLYLNCKHSIPFTSFRMRRLAE